VLWQGIRRARDPIEHVRTLLLDNGFASEEQLRKIEKQAKQVGGLSSTSVTQGQARPFVGRTDYVYAYT
jgi:TPP-dependent pyruvate/acetoin dehydrogenase alpha subunit